VRALLELDQALLQILRLAEDGSGKGEAATAEEPGSLREGLSLLQIRVRNLQHSMGLEVIPTKNQPFDDRWHEAYAVAHRPDVPDRWIVEEILPGYRLGERVVRPAKVVVNRLTSPS
jgi:molecular chaperone GrpE